MRRVAWFLTALYLAVLVSCDGHRPVFPPGEGNLRFSCDTLSLDTLFARVPSTTAWMRVYNAGRTSLTLDSVCLQSGGSSGFRVSLDAYPGPSFYGLDIPAGDSLFLFVEVTAPSQASTLPVRFEDNLLFYTSEGLSKVCLEAYAWDAQLWRGKVISADTVLYADRAIVIYDSLVVAPGTKLRVEEGVSLYFHDQAALYVYGTIECNGTLDRPVMLRGDRLDMAFPDFPYEFYPGQWTAVYLAPESQGNRFIHTSIRGAYYGIFADSTLEAGRLKLYMADSEIFNMVYSCLYAVQADMELCNTVLANSGSYTLAQIGGNALYRHCTVANFQTLVAREQDPSVVVVNFTGDPSKEAVLPYPLARSRFENCIVYGNRPTELGLGLLEEWDHGFYMDHCLVRVPDSIASDMACGMLYNQDPLFLATGKKYRYDFRLDSVSPARGAGAMPWAEACPLDARGLSRLEDGAPDLGAYEWSSEDF